MLRVSDGQSNRTFNLDVGVVDCVARADVQGDVFLGGVLSNSNARAVGRRAAAVLRVAVTCSRRKRAIIV